MSFDEILENRIGFGKYQIQIFLTLSLIQMNEGVLNFLIPNLNLVLQKEFNIQDNNIMLITSIYYFGMFFGGISSGQFSNKYGRVRILFTFTILQYILGIFQIFYINEKFLMLVRFIYGTCVGMCLGIVGLSITEILTVKMRGKILILLNFAITFGEIYALLVCHVFMKKLDEGNWKIIIVITQTTNLFVPVLLHFFVYESPRYLISKNQIPEAIHILNKIGTTNNANFEYLTQPEREGLEIWRKTFYEHKEQVSFFELFNEQNFKITWRIYLGFVSLFICFAGTSIINPFIFQKHDKNVIDLIWGYLGKVPAIAVSLLFIDSPSFGRKNSIIIFLALSCISTLLDMFMIQNNYIDIYQYSGSISSFLEKCAIVFLIPLSQEGFSTHVRALGCSSAFGIGSLATAILPMFILELYNKQNQLPFMLFLTLLLLSCLSFSSFPFDTQGKTLEDIRIQLLNSNNNKKVSHKNKNKYQKPLIQNSNNNTNSNLQNAQNQDYEY